MKTNATGAVSSSSSLSSNAQSLNSSRGDSSASGGGANVSNRVGRDDTKMEVAQCQKHLMEFDFLEASINSSNASDNLSNNVAEGKKALHIITTDETDVLSDMNEGDVDFYTPRQQSHQQHFKSVLTAELPPSRF